MCNWTYSLPELEHVNDSSFFSSQQDTWKGSIPTAWKMTQLSSPFPHSTPWTSWSELMKDVFEVANEDCARDFLFRPDSCVDAQILSSPLQMSNSMSLSMIDISEPSSPSHVFMNALVVPAYCVGHFSLLYSIDELGHRSFPELKRRKSRRIVRCVRNDLTGASACVALDQGTGVVEVNLFFPESTRRSYRAALQFSSEFFDSALDSNSGNISHKDAEHALLLATISTSDTGCFICSGRSFENCRCNIALQPAAHPLCFDNHSIYMMQFLGDFYHETSSTSFDKGSTETAKFRGYYNTVCGTTFGISNQLHGWALEYLLQNQKVSPLHPNGPTSCLPPIDDSQGRFSGYPCSMFSIDERGPSLQGAQGVKGSPMNHDVFNISTYDNPLLFTNKTGESVPGDKDIQTDASVASVFHREKSYCAPIETPITEHEMSEKVPAYVSPGLDYSSLREVSGNHTLAVGAQRKQVLIAPAPVLASDAAGMNTASTGEGAAYLARIENERLAKLERRRMRNRAAAAKSNARRKLRRMRLRQRRALGAPAS